MMQCKRTASVKSKNYCITARLDQKSFEDIVGRFPDFKTKLKKHSRLYADPLKTQMREAITKTEYFNNLAEETLDDLVYMLKQEQFDAENAIFREGDPCRGIMYLMEGSIELCHVEGCREVVLDALLPGSYLFPKTLVSGFPVQLTGIAKGKVTLLVLETQSLNYARQVSRSVRE